MTDFGVTLLADALYTNNTLKILDIGRNKTITENGLTCLFEAVSRHSGLEGIHMSNHFGVDESKVKKTINKTRKKNGLPDIYLQVCY
ncbi:MAG: hypothetical protein MJE68_04825 [Proteobacteria bacterium]|nr:hypothetical protein [Pseudomonadota bacterium]